MRSLLVVKDGAVGDSLLLAPALDAIRRRHPGARITLAGPAWRLRILASAGLADAARPAGDPEAFSSASLAGHDEVVAFAFDPDDPFAEELRSRARGRVVARPHFPDPGSGVHVADHVHRAFAHLGIGPEADRAFRLPVPESARAWARSFLEAHGARPGRRVYIHPGTKIATKEWPAERFVALGRALVERGCGLVVGRGPMDEAISEAVERGLAGVPFVRAHGHNLERTAGLLAECDAYAGVDSGVTHLAALAGRPTVAVYGPTRPAMWGPIGRRVRVLAGSRGRPCCERDHPRDCEGGCTAEVGVDEVLEAVLAELG